MAALAFIGLLGLLATVALVRASTPVTLTLEAQLAAAERELRAEEMRHETEVCAEQTRHEAVLREARARHGLRVRQAKDRVEELQRCLLHQHRQQGNATQGLAGIAAVQDVFQFHFLDGPADVLSASTACRRWRELACADSVWRARFEREGLVERARLFEVALPLVPLVQGGAAAGGSGGNSTTTASERDELAGVGLAFYAQVFALEVRATTFAACAAKRVPPTDVRIRLTTARARRRAGVQDEGRGYR